LPQDVEPSLTERAGFWVTLGAMPGGAAMPWALGV
jgi:hypothetical protein